MLPIFFSLARHVSVGNTGLMAVSPRLKGDQIRATAILNKSKYLHQTDDAGWMFIYFKRAEQLIDFVRDQHTISNYLVARRFEKREM